MATNPDELCEMRFSVPRHVYDIFDAVVKSSHIPKNKLAPKIVAEWAANVVHQANLVTNLTRGNGNVSQTDWGELAE